MIDWQQTLVAAGFNTAPPDLPKRLICSLDGDPKTGKTHFAHTAPEPIFYFTFDRGGREGVANQFPDKAIYEYVIQLPRYDPQTPAAQLRADFAPLWEDFKVKLALSWQVGEGTVVLDTATEMYELIRLARFGKLTQILPRDYGPLYAEMSSILRDEAYETRMNAIYLHKLGDQYINDQRTGQRERKGYKEMEYLVQANLETVRVDSPQGPTFAIRMRDCRLDASLIGRIYTPPLASFRYIMEQVHNGR